MIYNTELLYLMINICVPDLTWHAVMKFDEGFTAKMIHEEKKVTAVYAQDTNRELFLIMADKPLFNNFFCEA